MTTAETSQTITSREHHAAQWGSIPKNISMEEDIDIDFERLDLKPREVEF